MTTADKADGTGTRYSIQELPEDATTADVAVVEMTSVTIELEGVSLRRYSGEDEVPPLGQYKFLRASGPLGEDQILFAEAPVSRFRLKYSTEQESRSSVFTIKGRGFQYVTSVLLGGVELSSFTIQTDRQMELEVPIELAPSVVVGNIGALVELEESPAPTDIIFDLSTRVKRASGSKLLQQRFLTLLLSPDGADLMNLIPKGLNATPSLRTVMLNRVGLAVNVTKTKIQRETAANAPADEILASATVEGVSVDPDGTVNAQVRLTTLSGRNLSFPVGV
jgi:hypothetical protein